MKEVKDSVKSVKIEKNLGGEEDDVMVDVVDLGETGARVREVASCEKSGNGSVKEELVAKSGKEVKYLGLSKVKRKAVDRANASKDNNVGVDAMEVTLNDVWMTGSEIVVGDAVVESLSTEGGDVEGEVGGKDKGVEIGVIDETVEGNKESVKDVAKVDGVVDEKSIKDESLDSGKVPESGTKVDEVAVVNDVVDVGTGEGVTENLERKDKTDQMSKEESSQMDNAKVEDESKSSVSAPETIEEEIVVKEAESERGSPIEIVEQPTGTIDETHNFQDDQSVLNSGKEIAETHIEVPDSTVEVPSTGEHQTYAEHNVLPGDLDGEDAGMDLDEVLGWKDEIPGPDICLLESELKVDFTNLSTYTYDMTQFLENEIYVSLQQLNYFSPPENEGQFNVSDLVWGKVRSHLWWPGQIFDPSDASEKAMKHHKKDCFLVAYFGDRTFAWNESTVLKPFRSNFSQIEKHSTSEAFNNAVDQALEEVSRRVELGLTCSCVSPDVYKKIKCQIVENSGIKEESSRRHGVDKSASVNSFEPDKLVDYMRLLAKFPNGESDKMDLTIAKAQSSSYGRYKGLRELAEYQLCGDLLEEGVDHVSEDGTKKRKAVDTISDGSEKRPTLHSESAAKPSFKIGASIQKVASQLTAPADQVFVNADPSNQAEMLSQLQSTARDPMKVNSSSNNIIPFFNSHRSAVLTKSKQNSSEARKRKPSNGKDPEEYEFDDVNDSYWTDRIIENYPEDQLVQENQNGSVEHHQLVAYEQAKLQQQRQQQQQQQQPVKQTRRSNKKRFFSSNHEIEAKEQLERIERRRQNLATEVLMKYPEGIYFPSEIHLNKMFRRFGPLMESETEVDRQSGRARVVFKKCSDAEVAHSSAGKFSIFGSIIVNYELNYTPLISYKPMPLPTGQDPQDAC